MPYYSRRGAHKGHLLSNEEAAALRNVFSRKEVTSANSRYLKKCGLIEQRLGSWILTQQGHIHLLFCNAR
jgi:hypothetical protein